MSFITFADAVTTIIAIAAFALSVYNTVMQRRDRQPRLVFDTYWVHPPEAPMALRGNGNPVAPSNTAIYKCEITNFGSSGVKIRQVKIFPQAPPGKPLEMELSNGEQSKKLENGDSQTWSISTDMDKWSPDESRSWRPEFEPDMSGEAQTNIIATDNTGKEHSAKTPTVFPYPY